MNWQPIETVPKRGYRIILIASTKTGIVLPIGISLLETAMADGTPEHLRLHPTHWMELPEPPSI